MELTQALKILSDEAHKGLKPQYPLANMVGFDNPSNLNARKRIAQVKEAEQVIRKLIQEYTQLQRQFPL